MSKALSLLVVGALLLLAPRAADADDPITIEGRVVLSDTQAPVIEATVSLRWDDRVLGETTAGPSGRFRLSIDAPGEIPADHKAPILEVRAPGTVVLCAASPNGRLASADVGTLNLERGRDLLGVVRGEYGEPVPEAHIELQPPAPDPASEHRAGAWDHVGLTRRTTSDAEGRFAFLGLAAGTFSLDIVAPGYVSSWLGASLSPQPRPVDVRLRRGQSVRVRVEDLDGEPVAGARVNRYLGYRRVFAGHYKTHLSLDGSFTTDAAGRCVVNGLRDRNHHITAQGRGGADVAGYVLPGGPEVVLRLGSWRGSSRYVYEDGPGGGHPWGLLPPGIDPDVTWTRSAPTPEPESMASSAPDPAPEPEAPRPPPPPKRGRILVRVLSADGVPMPGAYVGFEGPEDEAVITEEDGTDLLTLAAGRYTYRASPTDFGTEAAGVHGTLDVKGGVEIEFEVRMPLVYAVPIEVQGADGVGVPTTQLEIERSGKTKRTWTDRQGRALLFAERDQPFSVLAQPRDRPTVLLDDVEFPVGERLILRALACQRLHGRVSGPDGAPLFGARVEARREGLGTLGEEVWTAWTDDRGAFVLEGPSAARYAVSARHGAFATSEATVAVGGTAAALHLELRPIVRLRGRLFDPDGRPIAGAEITNVTAGHGWVGSGEDGRFVVTLPAGAVETELKVTHPQYASRVVRLVPHDAGEPEIRLSCKAASD